MKFLFQASHVYTSAFLAAAVLIAVFCRKQA
jgi:hypothetical protein